MICWFLLQRYGINFINLLKEIDELKNLSQLPLFVKDVYQTVSSRAGFVNFLVCQPTFVDY